MFPMCARLLAWVAAAIGLQLGCASDSKVDPYPTGLQCTYEVMGRSLGQPLPTDHYFEKALFRPNVRAYRPWPREEVELPLRVTRWSDRKFPLRVSIETPPVEVETQHETLRVVQQAIREWSGSIDGTEPTFVFRQTSAAEIRVRWVEALPPGRLGQARVLMTRSGSGFRPEAIQIPTAVANDDGQLRVVILHETGHALGISGHSDEPADIMYAAEDESQHSLTERDRETLRMLYACPQNGIWVPPARKRAPGHLDEGPWDQYD